MNCAKTPRTSTALPPARRLNARFEGLNNEAANEGYSKANIAMIIVGGLWLMLVLLGTFLPEPEELEQGTSLASARVEPILAACRPGFLPPGFTFALRLSR